MATGTVGSLVVQLGLDAAQFTSGLTKSEYQARKFGEALGVGIKNAAALAAASIATIATGAIAGAVAIDTLVKQAGDFQDLAEKTGASAEALASFGVAAAVGGTSVDAIAAASIKLTKNLTGVDDESKAAGAAIAALGLNIDSFKKLAPEDQISATSKALAGFADGASKTAVATALFGKSGADLLPFLKALEEQGGRQVILTAQQIAQADDYADKQAKSRAQLQQYAQALATQALPAITAFQNGLIEVAKELAGLDKTASDLSASNALRSFAEAAAIGLGTVFEAAVGVAKAIRAIGGSFESVYADARLLQALTPQGAALALLNGDSLKSLFDERQKKAAEANQRYIDLFTQSGTQLTDSLRKSFAEQARLRNPEDAREAARFASQAIQARGGASLPTLNFNGAIKGAGAGDDPTKKLLDNQLKALENAIREEEDLLRSRNKILELYNGDNLISTRAYFDGKRVAQAAAVSSQIALYDQEIAALQKYQATAGKATDRETAQGKINDLVEKKKRLTREAGETTIEWGFRERQAAEALGKQLNSVNADILELTGNLAAAARIRIADQLGDLRKRLEANGDTAGLSQLDRLEKLKVAQADFSQQQDQAARAVESLRIQEERLGLSQQVGALGELEALSKIGAARRGALGEMRALVEAQEAIARASGNPKLVQDAERARLEFEKLAAVVDPLADKFNTLFADAAGSAFTDFITGAKSAKDAIRSFTSTVERELVNLIAKDLFKKVFSGGPGGGVGGSIGNAISGGLDGVLKNLFGGIGSFFGGFFADGGTPPLGKVSVVGERGPELFVPHTSGTVIPNGALGGGGVAIANTYNIDARGADPSLEPRLRAMLERNKAETLAQVQIQSRRGGRFTTAVRGS